MSVVTPVLDTMLPQVLGRAGDLVRLGRRSDFGLLTALRPIDEDMSPLVRDGRGERPGLPVPEPGTVARARPHAAGAAERAAPESLRGTTAALAAAAADALPSTELHLSRGAQALLQALGEKLGAEPSRPVTAERPLADSLFALQPARLAGTLARQVRDSGLFYESYLAAWVRDQLPRSALDGQPQARLAPFEAMQSERAPERADAPQPQTAGAEAAQQRVAHVVRQQVELLASGLFQWQGEAWPGVPMRWSIGREYEGEPDAHDDPGGGEPEETPAAVGTALSLHLPGIGAFEARLRLVGERISVTAWAEPGIGHTLLAADLRTLQRRLGDAGFLDPGVRLVNARESS